MDKNLVGRAGQLHMPKGELGNCLNSEDNKIHACLDPESKELSSMVRK